MVKDIKIKLDEDDIPKQWYNILPDLPKPLSPPIDPKTQGPIKPEDLEPVFSKSILEQEMSSEHWIDIPEEVRDIYTLWRPTPLHRAYRLEDSLKTPAKIYYKWEGVSPPGSHKPNTAVAQAYYNKEEGVERLTTETGAGQWGSALVFGANLVGLESTVYMVRVSYQQKPYRKSIMVGWGGEVIPSPSEETDVGKKFLDEDPETPGSLGISIAEAVEDAIKHENAKYTIGSVLNHVLLHQTVIGLETKKQFEMIDEYPDLIIGCCGGGSSFSGLYWPFYYDKATNKAPKQSHFIATEPTACPTLTRGIYRYDHGDMARLTPLLKMYTLGHDFIPPPIHSGGLRYHGDAPPLCLLVDEGIIEPRAYNQIEVLEDAVKFARAEGIIPAPEPAHAIKGAMDEAIKCKETGEEKVILFLLCGHGHFDMAVYDEFFEGKLKAYEYPKEEIEKSLDRLEKLYPRI